MNATDVLAAAKQAAPKYQPVINEFIDLFRRSSADERQRMMSSPIEELGALEGLVAAVVSALCRETRTVAPDWLDRVGSPDPFFAFPAKSFRMRLRLMLESPPPFRIRNVFVPENYLSRA
jgi:hypothetical protein